jgi:DnaK suppressor protein
MTRAKKSTTPAVAAEKPSLKAHPDAKLTKKQVEQLYERLIQERDRVTAGMGNHLSEAIGDNDPLADEMDVAQRHSEQAYLMRFADKERKLLGEIGHALAKLEEGEYGLCEGTGEPISFKRLELRPWTRYSVEYKEQIEREKRQHRIG